MGRRIMPVTFWSCALLSAALLVADAVRADRPPASLLGHWDGFYQQSDPDEAPGRIRSDITRQVRRRIAGNGVLLDSEGLVLSNALNWTGTLAGDDFVHGVGRTLNGRVVFDADLELVPGATGNAGVMDPQYLFIPVRGRPQRTNAILLHPFPDVDSPDIAASGLGTFQSRADPTFKGELSVQIFPRDRDSFPGHVDFFPDSILDPPFSWQLRATTSNNGRALLIAQGKTGQIVYNGNLMFEGGSTTPTAIWGLYRLNLLDGRTDFGSINFNLATGLR